ncbi:hypothetical protein [Microbacterium sp. Marseille-Q6965]|uniref:hypothetical protein n=1 Tax=Microbacterium sp. Marseille-Q6965 TaxID=2965072 RepID=UPI0021B784EF|nr:hypothetical protein [Microbacterium sp. Marseille-Q6965]
MTSADAAARPALGARAWTGTAGRPLFVGIGTVAAAVLAAVLTGSLPQPARMGIVAAILVAGVVLALVVSGRSGVEAVHGRVAAARAAWAAAHGWTQGGDGPADPQDVDLAIPRGWSVTAARGRIMTADQSGATRVETWVLRAIPGSRRQVRRREIVVVPAATGQVRFAASNASLPDPLLITPAWTQGGRRSWTGADEEPAWAGRVRELVSAHRDLPLSVTVGLGRVVVFAMDDPRPETAAARVALARQVAAIIA